MLDLESVLVEETVEESGVKMDEAAGDRTGADAGENWRFAGLSQVGVGVGAGNK